MRRLLMMLASALAFASLAFASPVDDAVARGVKSLAAKDIVAAMEAFTEALEADPAHAVAAYERGRILLTIGEPENAVADFTTAVLGNPNYGRAYAGRAQAKLLLKDPQSAIADFDMAIRVAPEDYEVHLVRATFRLKIGNLAGAKLDLQNAKAVADGATAKVIQSYLDKLGP